MRKVYFHEDDYGLIEIVPLQNYTYCKEELGKIDAFSQEHLAEGGTGWTAVYLRNENPISLRELKISVQALSAALGESLKKFDEVHTGYGSYSEFCPNTMAYGESEELAVFFDYDQESQIVKNIWLILQVSDDSQQTTAKHIFHALGKVHNALLVDWNWGFLGELNNEVFLDNYLREKIEFYRR